MSSLGDSLFAQVVAYSDLGEHRTGTPVDDATVEWFAAELEAMGAAVERQPYEFDRYDARWEVKVDGEAVESIPLFYEGVGRVTTAAPVTAAVPVIAGSFVPEFEPVAARALTEGVEAAVIATCAGNGLLMAVNRSVQLGSGLPTLCVAEGLAPVLEDAKVEVELEAEIVPGRSANVIARLGAGDEADTVLVTTPLSGWFRCAGERGTGIAIALRVAQSLAERGPVVIAGTTGHELFGLGQRAFRDSLSRAPRGIVHLGASAAAGEGEPLALAPIRRACGWISDDTTARKKLADALDRLGGVTVLPASREDATHPDTWLGEARGWSVLGVPLISIAGGFRLFHAPEDLPETATTPALLEQAASALTDAAALLQEDFS